MKSVVSCEQTSQSVARNATAFWKAALARKWLTFQELLRFRRACEACFAYTDLIAQEIGFCRGVGLWSSPLRGDQHQPSGRMVSLVNPALKLNPQREVHRAQAGAELSSGASAQYDRLGHVRLPCRRPS